MALHSSTLAWKIPWTEEPGRLQSMLRVGHDWETSFSLFTFMPWRRKWQPTPVFLPGEFQGRGSLVGCGLWSRTESDTTEVTYQQLFFWRRWWHPTPVLWPGKSHGRRSLVGCSAWCRWESDTTERLHFHFSISCIEEGNGNSLQYSCLENPRDREAWWAAVYGVTQSWTQLKRLSSSSKDGFGEGNGNPLQYSCLENPTDRGAWLAAVHGVARSRTWLSDFTFTFHFHALEKEMATHSSVLALPGDGGAWWASVSGVAQSRTWLKRLGSSRDGFESSSTIKWKWNFTTL